MLQAGLTRKMDVTLLIDSRARYRQSHENRFVRHIPSHFPNTPRNSQSPSQEIQGQLQNQALRLSATVHCHGICSIDVEGGFAGYRRLPQCPTHSPAPSWIHRASGQVHTRRCQRIQRLAHLGSVAKGLIRKARKLYANEELDVDLDNSIYALDSSTVDLSLTLFPWATFRDTKAGIKLHTQIDLRGPIPTCIHITEARKHDVKWLDTLIFEPGAIYLIDRGYLDFARLARIDQAGAFFVIRAKRNTVFNRQSSRPVDTESGLRSDQTGLLGTPASREAYPWSLRRVRYRNPEDGKVYVYLTNLHEVAPEIVATLYRMRWQIELFFRWIKQHLRIRHFYGTSANAVKIQIWISVIVYLIVAILHKELKLPGTLHRTFQVLSTCSFSQAPLHELLMESDFRAKHMLNSNQLEFKDL